MTAPKPANIPAALSTLAAPVYGTADTGDNGAEPVGTAAPVEYAGGTATPVGYTGEEDEPGWDGYGGLTGGCTGELSEPEGGLALPEGGLA